VTFSLIYLQRILVLCFLPSQSVYRKRMVAKAGHRSGCVRSATANSTGYLRAGPARHEPTCCVCPIDGASRMSRLWSAHVVRPWVVRGNVRVKGVDPQVHENRYPSDVPASPLCLVVFFEMPNGNVAALGSQCSVPLKATGVQLRTNLTARKMNIKGFPHITITLLATRPFANVKDSEQG